MDKINKLDNEIQTLDDEKSEIKKKSEKLEKENDEKKLDNKRYIAIIEKSNDNDTITKFQKLFDNNQEIINKNREDIDKNYTRIEKLKVEIDKLKVEIKEKEAKIDKLKVEIKEKEDMVDETPSLISYLQSPLKINVDKFNLKDIETIISQDLNEPISIYSHEFKKLQSQELTDKNKLNMIVKDSKNLSRNDFNDIVIMPVINWKFDIQDNGENINILYYDTLIRNVMVWFDGILKSNWSFNRNTTDSSGSTLKQKRPDFLAWNGTGSLAMKGEEKSKLSDFDSLVNEIKDKTKQEKYADVLLGKMPFLFAYIGAGYRLQLVMINRSTQEYIDFDRKFTYNLKSVGERLQLIVRILNICRIISYFEINDSVKFPYKLNDWIKLRSNQQDYFVSHMFTCDQAIKKIENFENYKYANISDLKNIYENIKNGYIINCAENIKFKHKLNREKNTQTLTIVNRFYPYKIQINTLSELKNALKNIIFALNSLHKMNFVHRDLRWPNILYSPEPIISKGGQANYLLNDFENSGQSNKIPPMFSTAFKSVLKKGMPYTDKTDIYFFGMLIKEYQHLIENDSRLMNLIQITQLDEERRPNSQEIIDNKYFD